MHRIAAACGCNTGKLRRNNEDNFFFEHRYLPQENDGLDGILSCETTLNHPVCFGIFDGMGGEALGEEASYLAAQTMDKHLKMKFELPRCLLDICIDANKRICLAACKHNVGLMGATAVLLGFSGATGYVANIGDSRAFLYRSGKINQISVDHTDQFLFAKQDRLKRKPRLTQHLGIDPEEMIVEPYIAEIKFQKEDLFLLCSDGLTDMLDENEIKEVLHDNSTVASQTEILIQRALRNGGRDNITVILCKIE